MYISYLKNLPQTPTRGSQCGFYFEAPQTAKQPQLLLEGGTLSLPLAPAASAGHGLASAAHGTGLQRLGGQTGNPAQVLSAGPCTSKTSGASSNCDFVRLSTTKPQSGPSSQEEHHQEAGSRETNHATSIPSCGSRMLRKSAGGLQGCGHTEPHKGKKAHRRKQCYGAPASRVSKMHSHHRQSPRGPLSPVRAICVS